MTTFINEDIYKTVRQKMTISFIKFEIDIS